MINKKAIVLLIATSVFVAAFAGIAFAQYVGAQTSGTKTSQTPQGQSVLAAQLTHTHNKATTPMD